MRVLVTGATGLVGKRLCYALNEKGHEVVVLSRGTKRAKEHFSFAKVYSWSPSREETPQAAFDGVDAVINLMGENIGEKRWTPSQKEKILKSRVVGTENLVKTMNQFKGVKTFISTSAIGYYPVNTGKTLKEDSPKGSGFLSDVCHKWENAAKTATSVERLVTLRVGVVLAKEGGVLGNPQFITPFKLGLGGPIGTGNFMVSWIHIDDLVRIYLHALETPEVKGIYNAVAPNPTTNKLFSKAIAHSFGKPAIFPVPPFLLKIILGEMSTIALDGQTVSSEKIAQSGLQFQYPEIEGAVENALKA